MFPPTLRTACLTSLALLFCATLQAQIPAFPGAEGYGAYAKGGRGGDVYHVTNLNASGTGSFADAIASVPSAGRTIVFDVSGYIRFPSGSNGTRLTASKVTIAGQTAPGDGIGFYNNFFRISGDDIVIRHLRFRHGKYGSGGDCIDLDSGSLNSILDHVSMQFSTDENMSSYGSAPENLTLQYSLNAWGLETHSCGGLWDQNHATSHHNLWAHNHTRNPKSRPSGLLEWINNVTYDWDIGFIMGDTYTPSTFKANVRSNYFICPPGNIRTYALEKGWLNSNTTRLPTFSIYLDGNYMDRDGDGILNGSAIGYERVQGSEFDPGEVVPSYATTPAVPRYYKNATPFTGPTATVTIDSPLLAYKKIVSNAGALRLDVSSAGTVRDEVDTILIHKLTTQTPFHVTRESDTGASASGFGVLNSTAAPVDTDKDGMPDFYETALGWSSAVDDHNTALASSGGVITGNTFFPTGTVAGYTRLEEYLHFLAIPHGNLAKNVSGTPSSITVDLRKFTAGFSVSPSFAVTNVTSGTVAQYLADGTTASATGPIVKFTPTLNYVGRARFDFTVTDEGVAWTQTCALVITNSGLPRDLSWKGDGSANAWDSAANNWLSKSAVTAFNTGDRVAFDDLGPLTVSLPGAVAPATVDVNATGNYTFAGAGSINATEALTKRGSGTLSLNNTGGNSFSSIAIEAGSVAFNSTTASGTSKISFNGGAASFAPAANAIISNPLEFNAPATITVGSQHTESGNWTGSSPVTIASPSSSLWTIAGTWTGFTGAIHLGSSNARLRLNGNTNTMFGSTAVAIDLGSGSGQLMNRNGSATTAFDIGSLEATGTATQLLGTQTGTTVSTYSIGALNTNTTFAGVIANGGGATHINKVGTGSLTLSGTSTHTGATNVNAGTLIVAGTLSNSPVTVAGGAVLAGGGSLNAGVTATAGSYLSPGTVPFTGAIMNVANGLSLGAATIYGDLSSSASGANDKIVVSSGALTFTGTPTFQFQLLQGTLGAGEYDLITAPSSVVPGGTPAEFPHNLPVGSRQTFTVKRTGSNITPARVWLEVLGEPATLTWSGATSAIWDSTTGPNWGGATPSTFGSNDAVVFNDSSTNLSAVSISGSVAPRNVLVNNTSRSYTLNGTGAFIGTGSLTKSGAGVLTISNTGSSSFSGGTTINGGSIMLTDSTANASGLGTGPITFNGGTLTMAGFTGSNSVEYSPLSNALIVPAGQTGTLQLTQRAPKPGPANIFPAIYGALSGGGTLNLAIKFIRADVLGDWSAFTGVINVTPADADGGDFRFGTSGSWPGLPAASVNLGNNIGAYYVGTSASGAGTTIEIGELSGTTSSTLRGGATGARNFAYRIGARTLVGSEVVFAGTIAEQGADTFGNVPTSSYTKTGAGTWTLSGNCNWNGGTTVEQGTLKISGSVTCRGATSVATLATINLANGSLSTDALAIANGATLIASGNARLTGDLNNDGTVTATTGGTLTVTGAVVNNGTMRIANGSSLIATGGFVNNGVLDLLTATPGLPANLENNGLVIDSTTLRTVAATKSGNTVTVIVESHSGHVYQLQRRDSLNTGSWTNVPGSAAPGATQPNGEPTPLLLQDTSATGSQGYYRVQITP